MNNKQLYKISKFVYLEAFFQSQLDMAGSQQDKILEKMEKNKNKNSRNCIEICCSEFVEDKSFD